jgi:hypothetical protein
MRASKHHQQLDRLARVEKLRLLRNWCLGVGLVACLVAIESAGGWSIANPKTWSSAYESFAAAGVLRWVVVPLLGLGGALLLLAVFLSIIVARRQR